MKIYIKSEEKHFSIIFPTAMLLNRCVSAILLKSLKKKCADITLTRRDLVELIKALKHYKRKHGALELVNIKSADGETVIITV